jgi:hypothetical protein
MAIVQSSVHGLRVPPPWTLGWWPSIFCEPRVTLDVLALGDDAIAEGDIAGAAFQFAHLKAAAALAPHIESVASPSGVRNTRYPLSVTTLAKSASSFTLARPRVRRAEPKSSNQCSGLSMQWSRRSEPSGNGTIAFLVCADIW